MQGTTPISLSAALLTPNQQITISDSPGINTLRLVGGLEIVGSSVSNTAVQLTLNNGALVTLLGAESFRFQTGGDAITGVGSLEENFSSFVAPYPILTDQEAPQRQHDLRGRRCISK